MDQRSVLDRLAGAQVRIQRCGFVCGAEIQRECEVELIDVAGANPLVNGFDAVGELGFGEAGCEFEVRLGGFVWGRSGLAQFG